MSSHTKQIDIWARQIVGALESQRGQAYEDLVQEAALMLCENGVVANACSKGQTAFAASCLTARLKDQGTWSGAVVVPCWRERDSEVLKVLKANSGSVSLQETAEGNDLDYESVLPCGRYETTVLLRRLRDEKVLAWIQKNAPFLDYLLETNKNEAFAPTAWNSRPIVRAYMGTDEVKRLLRVFGGNLSKDERLAIEEEMFGRFLHAKNAQQTDDQEHAPKQDFYLAI